MTDLAGLLHIQTEQFIGKINHQNIIFSSMVNVDYQCRKVIKTK